MGFLGIPVIESSLVPPDKAWLIDPAPIQEWIYRRGIGLLELHQPTIVEQIFRQCRRDIARECPLIAPPEWADLPSLWPPPGPIARKMMYRPLALPLVAWRLVVAS